MDPIDTDSIQQAVNVLAQAANGSPVLKARLDHLKDVLKRLLAEIEEYEHVVFCRGAVACLLQSNVVRVLTGSGIPASKWSKGHGPLHDFLLRSGIVARHREVYVFRRDHLFGDPSPAAGLVLGRKANGLVEWKDRNGRTINTINKEEHAKAPILNP